MRFILVTKFESAEEMSTGAHHGIAGMDEQS